MRGFDPDAGPAVVSISATFPSEAADRSKTRRPTSTSTDPGAGTTRRSSPSTTTPQGVSSPGRLSPRRRIARDRVRAVLGLPDDSPERAGVSSSAAKRALVALDDEFASYEARAAGRGAGTAAAGRETTHNPRRRFERVFERAPSRAPSRVFERAPSRAAPAERSHQLRAGDPRARVRRVPRRRPRPGGDGAGLGRHLSRNLSRGASPPLSRLASHLPRRPGRRTCRFRRRV